jgi:hypothetical protein
MPGILYSVSQKSRTQQRSNAATQQRSNAATQQHSNAATQQRSNAATQQRSNGRDRWEFQYARFVLCCTALHTPLRGNYSDDHKNADCGSSVCHGEEAVPIVYHMRGWEEIAGATNELIFISLDFQRRRASRILDKRRPPTVWNGIV